MAGASPISRRRFLAGLGVAAAGAAGLARKSLAWATAPAQRALLCRGAWRARSPTGGFRAHDIRRITVHHSAVKLTDNRRAPARFRSHQRAHQARGWPDIAYHVLIDRHGNVYKGRRFSAVGDTATDYDPKGHLLVMCEGNFEVQRPSAAQAGALVDVLVWACTRFGVEPRRIKGHRQWAHTSCPGRHLQRMISNGSLRAHVRERLAEGGVVLSSLCGGEGRARVRAIEAGTD